MAESRVALPTKVLGKTGVKVTVLGAGCAWLGRHPDGAIDQEMGVATIIAALEAGIRLIDTASMYAEGTAEVAVGEALRQRADLAEGVVVETKVRDARDFHYTADETRRSVETSLKRLGRDFIDVVYIHDPAAEVLDQVMAPDGALAALRQYQSQGVIGHVGIASNNPWDNAPYVETGEFEAAVVPDAFSLISQVAREQIIPAAERFGMGIVVATPLERGLLATGARAIRPEDHINRSFSPEVLQHVERLETVCDGPRESAGRSAPVRRPPSVGGDHDPWVPQPRPAECQRRRHARAHPRDVLAGNRAPGARLQVAVPPR